LKLCTADLPIGERQCAGEFRLLAQQEMDDLCRRRVDGQLIITHQGMRLNGNPSVYRDKGPVFRIGRCESRFER